MTTEKTLFAPVPMRTTPRSLRRTRQRCVAPQRIRAFTLIEILVVMGIIVLLITLALPAFNFITGSRSGEAASNQLSSVMSIARSQAIGVQQIRGIAIYHDKDTDRAVAGIVELRNGPFDTWVAGTSTASKPYTFGQYVQDSAAPARTYVCVESYVDQTGDVVPGTATGAGYWRELHSYNSGATFADTLKTPIVEFKLNSEFMTLPTGIDVRAAANTYSVGIGAVTLDFRYTSPAVFLFDANGQVVSREFRILREGILGSKINFDTASPVVSSTMEMPTYGNQTNPYRASAGIGLVVYNADQFKNATASFPLSPPPVTATATNMTNLAKIQDWLDQNATPAMLNRFNGTLVKGE